MREPEKLLQLLDEHIELLHQKHSLMRQMGMCVRQGDAAGLAQLMERESALASGMDALEQRTHELRERIAEATGVSADQVTVSRLAGTLDPATAMALNDRRERLLLAVEKLQEESSATARLVRYALEFNNQLLAVLVGAEERGASYSARGAIEPSCEGATFRQSA